VVGGDDGEHRVGRGDGVGAGGVFEVAGTGEGVLPEDEGLILADGSLASFPAIGGGVGAGFETGVEADTV
jgi:hypothetical protein